jgi:hypothetical protein
MVAFWACRLRTGPSMCSFEEWSLADWSSHLFGSNFHQRLPTVFPYFQAKRQRLENERDIETTTRLAQVKMKQ